MSEENLNVDIENGKPGETRKNRDDHIVFVGSKPFMKLS